MPSPAFRRRAVYLICLAVQPSREMDSAPASEEQAKDRHGLHGLCGARYALAEESVRSLDSDHSRTGRSMVAYYLLTVIDVPSYQATYLLRIAAKHLM